MRTLTEPIIVEVAGEQAHRPCRLLAMAETKLEKQLATNVDCLVAASNGVLMIVPLDWLTVRL